MRERVTVGGWQAFRQEGRLLNGNRSCRVEPKVMDLLFTLAERPGEVLSREELMRAVWPGITVGEDALAQCVFKLRKVLGEDGRRIETIPKRGYRLIGTERTVSRRVVRRSVPWAVAAAAIGLVAAAGLGLQHIGATSLQSATLIRADDSYMQFRRTDNEAAIRLYERALAADPESPAALAGLSNGLVQRALRWPDGRDAPPAAGSVLWKALASGQLRRPDIEVTTKRALRLAQRAMLRAPRDPGVLRALGLALSANGRLPEAAVIYDRALAIDPENWSVLINRADLHDIMREPAVARPLLERAYASMDRNYPTQSAQVRPWQAKVGIEIARRYESDGDAVGARHWYARTLHDDPSAEDARRQLQRLEQVAARRG